MAISASSGSVSAAGGVRPRIVSRRIPPPTVVSMPVMLTPKRSSPLRMPSIAPEMAKATVPMSSNIN